MSYIYILKLKNNKYYIGKTNNPKYRLEQHFQENGSTWTKIHKPIQVIKTIKSYSQFDEDKYTLEYIKKYGIENVRGGSFSQPTLSPEEKQVITKMIQSQKDQCYKCGQTGHFIKECKDNEINEENNDDWVMVEEPKSFLNKVIDLGNSSINFFKKITSQKPYKKELYKKGKCYRCGRYGHWANNCYAKTTINS